MRLILVLALLAAPLVAETKSDTITKSVPFQLGSWIDLSFTEGPVTLHRVRLAEVRGGITKSDLFRPGNTEHLRNVEIELEYSNSSSDDWEAHLDVTWKDSEGRVIDGYRDDESLDDKSSHDHTTVKLSTLRYGIDRATTFDISIRVTPD